MAAPIRREQLSADLPLGATKDPCRLATVANDGLTGLAARDGVTPIAGDRVLVKANTLGEENGIYVAAAGAWARSIDFDENSDADPGTLIPVAEGTANADTVWQLQTDGAITIGTTSLTFGITSRAGVDPGAHGTNHDPGGSDPVTTAAAIGLNATSTNTEGTANSLARSDHTHAVDTTNGTISTVNAGDVAAEGSGTGLARRDHQHAVATAAPGTIAPDDTANEGVSSSLARADHRHAIATAAPTQGIGANNAEGTGSDFARADHDHTIRESGGQDLTTGAIAAGQLVERSGTTLAGTTAINDTQHGNRGGGSLHSAATPSVAGFMSSADKSKLDNLVDPRFRDPKDSVRLKSTANVATLSGNQTIDGVLTAPGDRVALFDQTTVTQDGLYDTAAGAWTRTADFQAGDGSAGAYFPVEEGTANADTTWLVTNDEPNDIIGTDDLAVLKTSAGAPRGAGAGLILNGNDIDVQSANAAIVINADDIEFVALQNDTMHGNRGGGSLHALAVAAGAAGFLSGADKSKIDGVEAGATAETFQQERVTTEAITNTDTVLTDVLNNTPKSNASVVLSLNGVQQIQGAGEDYTISGTAITWLALTGTAINMKTTDDLVATYVS
jgi:phage-related tail fiber protein